MEKHLHVIWKEIQGVYKEDQVRNHIGNLTLKMNIDPNAMGTQYPELSTHIKGAQTRSLTHAVNKVFERLDGNKDGKLEEGEIPEGVRKFILPADADGGRSVTKEELEKYRAQRGG